MAIDWKHLFFQRILNLPEPKTKAPTANSQQTALAIFEENQDDNPWRVAIADEIHGEELPSQPAVRTATGVPWTLTEANASSRAWRRIARTVLLVIVLFFAWIGLRTSLWPPAPTPPAALPLSVTFDHSSAQAVATRMTISALTWDEDTPADHATAVGLDYVGGSNDLGWNRQGKQAVGRTIPGPVIVTDKGKGARVTVCAQVTTYARTQAGEPWAVAGTEWLTVETPIQLTKRGDRMIATAAPVLIGEVAPSGAEKEPELKEDPELTTLTKKDAEAFFTAYANGDVSALEAPGSHLAAPTSSWKFAKLATWVVDEGRGDTRTAHATVVWKVEGLTQELVQTYNVALTSVSGGDADRWQVSDIKARNN